MIGVISVRHTADAQNLPLRPIAVFVGSSMTLGVDDVPKLRDNIAVTGVAVSIMNAASAVVTVAAKFANGVWTATIPASHFAAAGLVTSGVAITASGTDESGEARTWCLGRGDLQILPSDGVPVPGEVLCNVHLRDSLPTTPLKGDLYNDNGTWKLYTGTTWIPPIDVSNLATKADATLAAKYGDPSTATWSIAYPEEWAHGEVSVSWNDDIEPYCWIMSCDASTVSAAEDPNAATLSEEIFGERIIATRTDAPSYQLGPDGGPNASKRLASEDEAAALRGSVGTLDDTKLSKSGGTMTGPLYVSSWTSVSGDNQKRVVFTDTDINKSSALLPDGSDIMTALKIAPAFSSSTIYTVGEACVYNGALYRCTSAHVGAWDASHFTPATVEDVLAMLRLSLASKANLTDLAAKANVSDLRYSYNTATVSSGTTPTVTNVADRAINSATLGSSVTAATVTLPAAVSGRARDFFIDLTIEATTAPTLTFIDPATNTTANVTFGADSLADIDTGENAVLFTEFPNHTWIVSVKHKEVS